MRKVSCLLIRHGKTQGNIEKRYIGCRTDEELCELGIKELKKNSLTASKQFQLIYVSPLRRCRQTAELLFPGCETAVVDALKEIDFGDFENKNYEDLKEKAEYQKWLDTGGTIPFPNGEDRNSFVKRSIDAFNDILKADNQPVIPFVIHGGNIMAIMSELTGKDYYSFQISCGEAYQVSCLISEDNIDVISYNRIFNRSDS